MKDEGVSAQVELSYMRVRQKATLNTTEEILFISYTNRDCRLNPKHRCIVIGITVYRKPTLQADLLKSKTVALPTDNLFHLQLKRLPVGNTALDFNKSVCNVGFL